jgi:hypothetical protein
MQAKPQKASTPDPEESGDSLSAAGIGFDGPAPSIDELVSQGNGDGLMELGAAYRVGTPHVARDAFKALECFEAASRLGNADAEYLVGRAMMDGTGIGADHAEGAKRLRSAAQRGSLRAKIYVANLYESGVYYQADREKADVWYRNVARAAGIESSPESPEHDAAMAELGCVRHCLKLVADEALPAKDRAFYLKKAKAMGYQHKLAQAKKELRESLERATPQTPDEIAVVPAKADEKKAEPEQAPAPEKAEAKKADEKKGEAEPRESLLGEQWTWGPGLIAFVGSAFFATAASAAGWLAMEGSRALAAADRALPLAGERHDAVFWAVVAALGALPAASAYRTRVFLFATIAGLAAGAGAYFSWDALHLLWDRLAQTAAGGLGVFLAVLLVSGVLGGTRARVLKREKVRLKPKRLVE